MRRTERYRGTRAPCRAIVWACLWIAAAAAAGAEPAPRAGVANAGSVWLGVWSGDAVDGGVEILAVVRGGPAEQGGLRAGDIVIEVGGRAVAGEADLGRLLRGLAPGDEARFSILRGGRPMELSLRLARRTDRPRPLVPPAPHAPLPAVTPEGPAGFPGSARGVARAGLTVTEIGAELRAHLGAPGEAGVLVTRVEPGAAAEAAGLEVGDVLVRIAEQTIRTTQEVRSNLVRWNVTRPLRFEVIRGGRPATLTLAGATPSSDTPRIDERQLRAEIDRLEQRLEELRRELERARSGD